MIGGHILYSLLRYYWSEIGCAMKKTLFSRSQEQTCQEAEFLEGLYQRMLKNRRSTCLFSELLWRHSGISKKYWDWSAEKMVATQQSPQRGQQYQKESRGKGEKNGSRGRNNTEAKNKTLRRNWK